MASVTLSQVAKSFGEVRVLHDINLEIAEGEFIVMVGPSGCGKSTLLRIIAGLESVATRIKIADLNDSLPTTTMIYVTHDQVEAMTLADRIVVLSADGGIEHVGTPLDLYRYPANLFVARFIGSPAMNILPATLSDENDETQITVANQAPFSLPFETQPYTGKRPVQFGIRPEDLHIATDDQWLIEGHVAYIESLGEVTQLYIDVGLSDETLMVVKLPGMANHSRGDLIRLSADTNSGHVFDEQGTSLRILNQ